MRADSHPNVRFSSSGPDQIQIGRNDEGHYEAECYQSGSE